MIDDLNWIDVDSSNVNRIAYENNSIYVEFYDGRIYEYEDCEHSLFEDFKSSESKGSFIHNELRGKSYKRIA